MEESISGSDLYNSTKDFLGISFFVEISSTSSIMKLNWILRMPSLDSSDTNSNKIRLILFTRDSNEPRFEARSFELGV